MWRFASGNLGGRAAPQRSEFARSALHAARLERSARVTSVRAGLPCMAACEAGASDARFGSVQPTKISRTSPPPVNLESHSIGARPCRRARRPQGGWAVAAACGALESRASYSWDAPRTTDAWLRKTGVRLSRSRKLCDLRQWPFGNACCQWQWGRRRSAARRRGGRGCITHRRKRCSVRLFRRRCAGGL